MKKLILTVAALVGISAFGAIDVAYSNIVGVIRVTSPYHNTLVSVPFNAVTFDEGERRAQTVSNLVQQVNLQSGDRLQLYNSDGDMMYSWRLVEGVWTPVRISYYDEDGNYHSEVPDSANLKRVNLGWAFKLYRQQPVDDNGKALPFYLIGEYVEMSGERVLEVGSSRSPKKSLVSFPGISTFDLNTIQEGVYLGSGTDNTGCDEISVITDENQRSYVPRLVNGKIKWGYYVVEEKIKKTPRGDMVTLVNVFKDDDNILPRGSGFWYFSRGLDAAVPGQENVPAPTIRW